MKNIILVFMMITFIVLSGCSGNKASEMFETAKFEELQNNKEHAVQLYEDIIKKYPQSEYAYKAKERLSEIKAEK